MQVQNLEIETKERILVPMKSGKFLLLHIFMLVLLTFTSAQSSGRLGWGQSHFLVSAPDGVVTRLNTRPDK